MPVDATPVSATRPDQQNSFKVLIRRVLTVLIIVVFALGCAFYAGGHILFTENHQDALRPADAIVVLGGEHDGREDYALDLARRGYARTVLMSNPYHEFPFTEAQEAPMAHYCNAGTATIEVICFEPKPSTTRGEALFTQQMAKERHWKSVIVVTWSYHIVRARYVFGQCFDGDVVMRSVPFDYGSSVIFLTYIYSYQFFGILKAAVVGCR